MSRLWVVNTRSELKTNRPRDEEPPTFAAGRRTSEATAVASCVVILSMLGLSVLKTHWKSQRSALLAFGYPFFEPRRVPGD